MASGVVFVVVYLLFLAARQLGEKQGLNNGSVPPGWGKVFLIWVIPILVFLGLRYSDHELRSPGGFITLCCLYQVLLFPSLYARLCIRMGWVKASFYLGRISFIHHRRDAYAGALFNALEAALKTPSPGRRRTQLEWIRGTLQKHQKPLFLGSSLVYLLLEHYLSEAPSPQQFYQRLRCLDYAYTPVVPAELSCHVFALAIQAPLLQRDWTQIAQLTWHWNTPATNPAARYLDASFRAMHQGTSFWQRLKLRYFRLCCWDQHWARQLVQQIEAEQHHAAILLTSAQPRARLWLSANLSSDEVEALSCSDAEQQYWQQRAQELGLWQAQESCQHLQQQYHQYLAQRAGASSRLSAAQLDALDQQEAQLQLLCQRIQQRLQKPQKFNPLREWLDWLAIAAVLRQLASHAATQQAAFFSAHSILWDWIADLWNKREMRCLARCMARFCLPLAKASGCHQFHLEFFDWR